MMGKRKRVPVQTHAPVAQGLQEPTNQYGPGSAAYSPMLSPGLDGFGLPETASQQQSPTAATSTAPVIKIPRPPLPSVGGENGRAEALGWTTGLRPFRWSKQPFRGATLVRPTMGVHPATGPVGLSNRQGRLQAGVAALTTTYLPSATEVRQMFTQPSARNANPLAREMTQDGAQT